ncbi:hypothetical protein LR48_Vigan03g059800 [Vigna angularis]|uniref:C2 NT-type domain-containing protein n=1 Tax=Phaseolus angularis TaxID=3914 RepID=A0A0L9U3G6_PHAAN|nr:uncharacterized protein HKW66_Vig0113230 [Vigna angularis]KOM37217.1 hypothetical protein LR48_Vigan03g059800 [Vigna angularis]
MGLVLQIKWKGPKLTLSSLRRNAIAKNFTREAQPQPDDVVFWDEEFHTLCTLSAYKDNAFHPWEIAFSIFNVCLNQRSKTKILVVGIATLNLAEFAYVIDQKDFDLNIPITVSGGVAESSPLLSISISLEESIEIVHKSIVLVPSSPVVQPGETTLVEKDELSTCNRRHRRSEASLARFLPLPKRVHQIARNAEPCIYH